jgi:Mu-like prophage I protein
MPDATSFSTFADAPIDLAADTGAAVSKRIHIAQLGRFKDPRYGEFEITAADVDSWRRLLSEEFQGEVPIDYDHNTDKAGPTGSRAAAWIKSIVLAGIDVLADVEFTPDGAESVRNREYRYISPTFVSDYKDKLQKSRGPALLRAALTNNPFLRDMPAISLSAAPLEAERIELDAPVGIGVGDRVALSHEDLSLGKEGVCVREYPHEDDGHIIHDVVWDDGTRSERVDGMTLRSLTPWRSLTLSDDTAVEPMSDAVTLTTLAGTVEELAKGLRAVTASLSLMLDGEPGASR